MLTGLEYYQVDVFTREALLGNGLAVIFEDGRLTPDLRQRITREMRQFESIFLTPLADDQHYRAAIYTMEEELPFAGHPILGAAATLSFINPDHTTWFLHLGERVVEVTTRREADHYIATMSQGAADFLPPIADPAPYLQALHLTAAHLAPYSMQVFSTGLPYLLVPISQGIEQAKIVNPNFEQLLTSIQAEFAYIFDVNTFEGRTWSNDGLSEDAATGSAVGPVGAYAVHYGLKAIGEVITIQQGRFVQRPSEIYVQVEPNMNVLVSGGVKIIARGQFF